MIDSILKQYSDCSFITVDGFDKAIIGLDENKMALIYSVSKCLNILQKRMNAEDSLEYLNVNIIDCYLGENTPVFCNDNIYEY